ncbi:uncharacterized protein SCHCODRAFT_02535618 [Schizophyllum commune H4-8]|nr:uncharacterized protein SCHCODRAFT_02535618 [Schizophyllum commune H4-8]KAI5895061.1 hypothetical protein SCHCODRAFT_02535618 [Schizophyllum commune H4-8]
MAPDAAQPDPFPEYSEGKELQLFLKDSNPTLAGRTSITGKIVEAYRPFTMSPVLLVSIPPPAASLENGPPLPSTAIFKLYDRRCFTNIRTDFDEGKPWSLEKEKEYRQYLDDVSNGSATPLDFGSPTFFYDNDVSDGEFEAYLRYMAQRTFDAERSAYERLQELQGKILPTLYGAVEYEAVIPNVRDGSGTVTEMVPGLLLEYVSSLSLRQLITTWRTRDPPLPDSILAAVCAEAVRVVDRVSDFEVLNEDVRVDNFLIRQEFLTSYAQSGDTATLDGAVVLIDLGQCRLRQADESEDEWIEAKWSQDETGAVGFIALNLVRRFVGKDVWKYERDLRYYRPLEE